MEYFVQFPRKVNFPLTAYHHPTVEHGVINLKENISSNNIGVITYLHAKNVLGINKLLLYNFVIKRLLCFVLYWFQIIVIWPRCVLRNDPIYHSCVIGSNIHSAVRDGNKHQRRARDDIKCKCDVRFVRDDIKHNNCAVRATFLLHLDCSLHISFGNFPQSPLLPHHHISIGTIIVTILISSSSSLYCYWHHHLHQHHRHLQTSPSSSRWPPSSATPSCSGPFFSTEECGLSPIIFWSLFSG